MSLRARRGYGVRSSRRHNVGAIEDSQQPADGVHGRGTGLCNAWAWDGSVVKKIYFK